MAAEATVYDDLDREMIGQCGWNESSGGSSGSTHDALAMGLVHKPMDRINTIRLSGD